MGWGCPYRVGSLRRAPAKVLAERVMRHVGERLGCYAIHLDEFGSVWIERPDNPVVESDLIAVVTPHTDPGWLADELEHEWEAREDA